MKRRVFPLLCPSLEGLTELLQTPAFQHFGEGGFGLVRHGPEHVSSLEMLFNFQLPTSLLTPASLEGLIGRHSTRPPPNALSTACPSVHELCSMCPLYQTFTSSHVLSMSHCGLAWSGQRSSSRQRIHGAAEVWLEGWPHPWCFHLTDAFPLRSDGSQTSFCDWGPGHYPTRWSKGVRASPTGGQKTSSWQAGVFEIKPLLPVAGLPGCLIIDHFYPF